MDSLTADEMQPPRPLTEPAGTVVPDRRRGDPALFGADEGRWFADGCMCSARIDMASPNLNMRDPTLYRIRASYHRTGDAAHLPDVRLRASAVGRA